jgi:MFS family permease
MQADTVRTLLRCNKCGRPVCIDCVRLTDVGYRCKECINQVQSGYYTANPLDYPLAAVVSFVVALVAAPITGLLAAPLGFFGFWIAILTGPAAGGFLSEIIRRAVGRRRGRYLWLIASAMAVLGAVVGNVILLLITGTFPLFNLAMLLFVGLALSAVYARLR